MNMHDTGWEDACYDGEDGAGRASGAGLDGGAGRATKSGGTTVNAFAPIGRGRPPRECVRYSFGNSAGYGYGYGTPYGSGERNNTGTGMGD